MLKELCRIALWSSYEVLGGVMFKLFGLVTEDGYMCTDSMLTCGCLGCRIRFGYD